MQMAKIPVTRSPEVETRIIEGLCDGVPLRELCRQEGMPSWRAVYDWIAADADFASRVAQARDTGTDAIAEQALDLIDEAPQRGGDGKIDPGYVQWKRAQVDTRLKLLACWNPKKYGSKQTVDVGNKEGEALKVESNAAEVAAQVAAALRAAKRDA
jgi:hypothetical protein